MLASCVYTSPEFPVRYHLSITFGTAAILSKHGYDIKAPETFVVCDAVLELLEVLKIRGRSFG